MKDKFQYKAEIVYQCPCCNYQWIDRPKYCPNCEVKIEYSEPYEPPIEEEWIELLKEFDNWQKKTFPHQTIFGKLAHLKKEIKELKVVLETHHFHGPGNLAVEQEFADCFMLLYGIAFKAGYSVDDIRGTFKDKFEINKKRKWGEPNADGSVQHLP